MRTKGIQTSQSDARHVGRPAGRTAAADSAVAEAVDSAVAEAEADSADLARCIPLFARSAARTLKCPSDPAATDPYTAAIATASSATGAAQAEAEAEDLPSATKPSVYSMV